MHSLNYPPTTKWVVAHNNNDIFHPCFVESQNCFETGQPFLDVFDSKEDLITAFPHLSSAFDFLKT
jgi:hypothetical protein